MRNTLFGLLVLGLLPAAENPVDKPAEKEVKRLIDRAFAAVGGKEKLAAFPAATMTIAFKGTDGTEGTVTLFVQKPDKLRQEGEGRRDGKKFVHIIVVNGDDGWISRDGEVNALGPRSLTGLKRLIKDFPAMQLGRLTDRDLTWSSLEERKVGERAAVGLEGAGGMSQTRLFFDKATGLLLEQETLKDGVVRETLTFSDYRETGGIKVPRKEVSKTERKTMENKVTSLKVVEILDPKLFEKP